MTEPTGTTTTPKPDMALLLSELLTRSRDRSITWSETDKGREFGVFVGGASARIAIYPNDYSGDIYTLTLRDESGRDIAQLSSERDGDAASDLGSLFDLARDSALRITDTLAKVLAGIQSGKVDEPPHQKALSDDTPF